jgi:hypothetical protein
MNPPSPVLTGVLIIAAGGKRKDDGFKTEGAAARPGCHDVDHPPSHTDPAGRVEPRHEMVHQSDLRYSAAWHPRNLTRTRDLIDRSLAEVPLKVGIRRREPARPNSSKRSKSLQHATIEAKARGLQLTVTCVSHGVSVEVDRQILAAAVANLLQNAFKFTHGGGHVLVRTHADADRVFSAIEDECGGLAGRPEDLFASFEQRGKDRSSLGLGLAIARQGVSANGGEIKVRNIAGQGCVFTVELPRPPLAGAVGTFDAVDVAEVGAGCVAQSE